MVLPTYAKNTTYNSTPKTVAESERTQASQLWNASLILRQMPHQTKYEIHRYNEKTTEEIPNGRTTNPHPKTNDATTQESRQAC
jgi:hypothetical protein